MYVKVRVIAGARKEIVERLSHNQFKISIKEKAERNLANKRIQEIIAMEYNIGVGGVRIINGHHTPTKLLSVLVEE